MIDNYYKDDNFFQYFRFIPKSDMCEYLRRLITDGHDIIHVCDEVILLPYFIPVEKLYDIIITIYGDNFGYDYYEAEQLDIINDDFTKRKSHVRYIIEDTNTCYLSCARYKKDDHVISFDATERDSAAPSKAWLKWTSHVSVSLSCNLANIHFLKGSAMNYYSISRELGDCKSNACDLEHLTKGRLNSDKLDVLLLRNNIDNYNVIYKNSEFINTCKPYIEILFNSESSRDAILKLLNEWGYFSRVGNSIIYANYIPFYN